MKKRLCALGACAFVLTLTASPRLVRADDAFRVREARPSNVKDAARRLTLSISPLHLTRPIFELTSEARLAHKLGFAVISGIGSVGDERRATYWDVGGQLVAYPVGSFDGGLQVGVEALYIGLAGTRQQMNVVTGAVNSLNVAPFVGCKWVAPWGLSIGAQSGLAYATAPGKLGALFNASVGWSF